MNMKQSLKQSVVEKFQSIELSPDQLAKFETPGDVATTHPSPRRKRFGWPAWSIATAAAVILSIGGFLANQMTQEHNARALLEAIAFEVR